MHNFIWRALVIPLSNITPYLELSQSTYLPWGKKPQEDSQTRAYPFHQLDQFYQAFPGHRHRPLALCFLREERKRKWVWMVAVISFLRHCLGLYCCYFSWVGPVCVAKSSEHGPEDIWRSTAQISATVGYSCRILQGTLVELPVQMPRNIILSCRK